MLNFLLTTVRSESVEKNLNVDTDLKISISRHFLWD